LRIERKKPTKSVKNLFEVRKNLKEGGKGTDLLEKLSKMGDSTDDNEEDLLDELNLLPPEKSEKDNLLDELEENDESSSSTSETSLDKVLKQTPSPVIEPKKLSISKPSQMKLSSKDTKIDLLSELEVCAESSDSYEESSSEDSEEKKEKKEIICYKI